MVHVRIRPYELNDAACVFEAVRLVRDWGFRHTELLRLEIVIAVTNRASHLVAEKAGAIREGTLRSRLLLHVTPHDATMFSFVRGDDVRA